MDDPGQRTNPPTEGGYDIGGAGVYNKEGKQLSSADKESLTCPVCQLMLRSPQQVIACGHRFCRPCITKSLASSPLRCPVDGEEIRREQVRVDRGCANEIKSLQVDCPARPRGCQWRSSLLQFEDHVSGCLFLDRQCVFCGATLLGKELHTHEREQCSRRLLSCHYCKQPVPAVDMEDHLSRCPLAPVTCDWCGQTVAKQELGDHKQDDCPEAEVTCQYCGKKDKLEVVNKHYVERHLHKIVKLSFQQQKATAAAIKKMAIQPISSQRSAGPRSLVEADSAFAQGVSHQQGVANPKPITSASTAGFDSDVSKGYASSSLETSETSSSFGSSIGAGAQQLMRETRDLALAVQALQKKEEATKKSLEQLIEQMEKQKSQLAGVIESSQTVRESVSRHAVTMEEIKLRQDILDVKTTSGVFIWKIPDIKRRYKDALDRRTLSLYSPPFHTSPHGYRMCIRAYLNGDGSGKTTHMSVFFVLMRSEHDNLLPWPFRQAVTFQLINQSDPAKSISETFLPDLQSPSFQQPQSEMNIASGFPRFVPQSVLKEESFIKGNAIYVKCKVDLNGLIVE